MNFPDRLDEINRLHYGAIPPRPPYGSTLNHYGRDVTDLVLAYNPATGRVA